jgi:tRNA(Arg) A34 adenosine deaminase TadA
MSLAVDHSKYMQRAVELARTNPRTPFGAVIVHEPTGEVLAGGANRTPGNPILHAETDAINNLAAGGRPAPWGECVIYCTAEPCAMCLCAIAWAGIPKVVYGISVRELCEKGWDQITIDAQDLLGCISFAAVELTPGICAEDCVALIDRALELRRTEARA